MLRGIFCTLIIALMVLMYVDTKLTVERAVLYERCKEINPILKDWSWESWVCSRQLLTIALCIFACLTVLIWNKMTWHRYYLIFFFTIFDVAYSLLLYKMPNVSLRDYYVFVVSIIVIGLVGMLRLRRLDSFW